MKPRDPYFKGLPIFYREKDDVYFLQKTFPGVGQRQVRLGSGKKEALRKGKDFMETALKAGFQAALSNHNGGKFYLPNSNPTLEEIEALYTQFCAQSDSPLKSSTALKNVGRLGFLMRKCNAVRIGDLDKNALKLGWYGSTTLKNNEKTTFMSAVRMASGVFKRQALIFYRKQKWEIQNPFAEWETEGAKLEQYSAVPETVRNSILWDCDKELAPNEAMIVLMALEMGLRRSEIEAAIPSWFSVQSDTVFVSIQKHDHFIPKTRETGVIQIAVELYERLCRLRGESDSLNFVPTDSKLTGSVRIRPETQRINAWLRKKGLKSRKPIHALRKECGTHYARKYGAKAAADYLRHSLLVSEKNYLGASSNIPADLSGYQGTKESVEQKYAAQLGLTVKQLKEALRTANRAEVS